ncbi:LCR-like protein [Medicago truncatula]|uniref:LCR-like protein n=1 Tax=Medicago truncatula TaxID=3880 RepID=A0A072VKH1_MEDTR|nr:LCR-like protein [Medicago truncatula]
MATQINRVHFFIAILCIFSVLTSGGANTSKLSACKYCIPKDSCGNNNQYCITFCIERGLPKDGVTCGNGLCCCYY